MCELAGFLFSLSRAAEPLPRSPEYECHEVDGEESGFEVDSEKRFVIRFHLEQILAAERRKWLLLSELTKYA